MLPPLITTPADPSTSLIPMAPLLVRVLLLFRVAATGPDTTIDAPAGMTTSSGWPLLAVAVAIGVVRAPDTSVSARAGAPIIRISGATAAAVSSDLRIKGTPPGAVGLKSFSNSAGSIPARRAPPRSYQDRDFVASMGREKGRRRCAAPNAAGSGGINPRQTRYRRPTSGPRAGRSRRPGPASAESSRSCRREA